MTTPAYVTALMLISPVGIIAAVLWGVRHAVTLAGWPQSERAATLRMATVLLVGWFAVALAFSFVGAFRGAADRLPTLEYGLFAPIIIGLALLRRSEILNRLLDAVPQTWLVGIQYYRALGVIFLLLLAQDRLPAAFALPAGCGDVAVGVLAPVVAWAYSRGATGREAMVREWNLLGLLDLAVAVTAGFLTSPSPLQMLSLNAPNELISAFPLVLIPVFAVPLSVLLHVASLIKLRRDARHAAAIAEA